MAKTKVEWATHSWSPITGCSKCSPGCTHCYAERMARRLAGRYGYPEAPNHFNVTLRPDRLEQPLRWRKPRMIFVCSMGDLFHKNVPQHFISRVFKTMAACPQHTFQILTKRPGLMRMFFVNNTNIHGQLNAYDEWVDWPLPNVWLGVSVENQNQIWRIKELMKCPAAVRFTSLEPLLKAVDLSAWLPHSYHCQSCGYVGFDFDYSLEDPVCPSCGEGYAIAFANSCDDPVLDWVITGGESGPGARLMHPQWARDIRDQCQAAGVAFFFKGWGEWVAKDLYSGERTNNEAWGCLDAQGRWYPETTTWNGRQFYPEDDCECIMLRIGKKAAGRLLDDQLWEEYPRRSK